MCEGCLKVVSTAQQEIIYILAEALNVTYECLFHRDETRRGVN